MRLDKIKEYVDGRIDYIGRHAGWGRGTSEAKAARALSDKQWAALDTEERKEACEQYFERASPAIQAETPR